MVRPNYPIRILAFTCVGHGVTHWYMILFTPLLTPMGAEFGLSLDGVTFYVGLATLFFGLGAIPAGWLSDKWGEKLLLLFFFFGCAAGGVCVGLAQNVWQLGFGAVLLGTATSIYHPVGNALISKGITARGRAMGINGIAGSIGTAVGPAFGALVAAWFSWRWAFLSLTVPTLLCALWLWRTDLGPAAVPVGKQLDSRDGRTTPAAPAQPPRRESPGSGRVLLFVMLLAAMTCGGLYYHLIFTVLPEYLGESGPFREQVSAGGILATIALTFGAAGQLVAGILADRVDPRKLYVANLALIVPMIFLISQLEGGALLVAACVGCFVIFGVQPIENTAIAQFTPARWRGSVFGMKFILAFGLAGGIGSWLSGVISGESGYSAAFIAAAAAAFAGLVFAVFAASARLGQLETSVSNGTSKESVEAAETASPSVASQQTPASAIAAAPASSSRRRRGLHAFLLIALVTILWALFPASPETVERYYSLGLYRWINAALVAVMNWIPFSLTAFAIVLLFVWVLTSLVRGWRKHRGWRARLRHGSIGGARWIITALVLGYFAFLIMWGAGYRRTQLENRLGLNVEEAPDDVELRKFGDAAVALIHALEPDRLEIDEERALAIWSRDLEKFLRDTDGVEISLPSRVRALPPGTLLYSGTAGFISPFFLEPHVDSALPRAAFLSVAGHELAHVGGLCREAEADLASSLAGLRSADLYVRYVAALFLAQDIAGALTGADRKALLDRLPPQARADLEQARQVAREYRIDFLSRWQSKAYDSYLKSQGVEEGTRDYDRGVRLLWAAWKQGLLSLKP